MILAAVTTPSTIISVSKRNCRTVVFREIDIAITVPMPVAVHKFLEVCKITLQ